MQNRLVVAAFYKFVALPDYQELKPQLFDVCVQNEIQGTILLAEEGLNGTIAGPREGIDAVLAYLRSDSRIADLAHKEAFADEPPFTRMKVKIKKEIVTIGRAEIDPKKAVGTYVQPHDWNALISDPDIVVIDTRNEYEVDAGTFQGAINPHTRSFRQFPDYAQNELDPQQHKKVAMFCTGGIRCEKATSLLVQMGFEEVYHLQGGILKYLEEVPQEESLWQGECFVFDDRITVDHNLEPGELKMCYACRELLTDADLERPGYEYGVSCHHCVEEVRKRKQALG